MMLVINSTKLSERTSPKTSSGACRVIYFARRAEVVYVLHAFHKKTQAPSRKDLEIAKGRFRQLLGGRI